MATIPGLHAAHGLAKAITGFVRDDVRIEVVPNVQPHFSPKENVIRLPGLPSGELTDHDASMLRAYLVHEIFERRGAGENPLDAWVKRLDAFPESHRVYYHRMMNVLWDVKLNRQIVEELPGGGMAVMHALRHHYTVSNADPATLSPLMRVGYVLGLVHYGFATEAEALSILEDRERDAVGKYMRRTELQDQDDCWNKAVEIVEALIDMPPREPDAGDGAPEQKGKPGEGKGEPNTELPQDAEGDSEEGEGEGEGEGDSEEGEGEGEGDDAEGDSEEGEGEGEGEGDSEEGEGEGDTAGTSTGKAGAAEGDRGQEGEGEGEGDGDDAEGDGDSYAEGGGTGFGSGGNLLDGDDFDAWENVKNDITDAAHDHRPESPSYNDFLNRTDYVVDPSWDTHETREEFLRDLPKHILDQGIMPEAEYRRTAQTMTTKFRQALASLAPAWRRHLDRGIVDPRKVARLATGASASVFRMRRPEEQVDTAVAVSLDVSGSMANFASSGDLGRTLLAWNESLGRLNVPTWIGTWTGLHGIPLDKYVKELPNGALETDYRAYPSRQNVVRYQTLKEFDERWSDERVKLALSRVVTHGSTPTADGLAEAINAIWRRPERRKIVVFITDGEPDGSPGHKHEIIRLRDLAQSRGIELLVVGVCPVVGGVPRVRFQNTIFDQFPHHIYLRAEITYGPEGTGTTFEEEFRTKGTDALLRLLQSRVTLKR